MDQPNANRASDSDINAKTPTGGSNGNPSDDHIGAASGPESGVAPSNGTSPDSSDSPDVASQSGDADPRPRKRRRGSRGGQGRNRAGTKSSTGGDERSSEDSENIDEDFHEEVGDTDESTNQVKAPRAAKPSADRSTPTDPDELPDPMREGRVRSAEAAASALVTTPKIGDTRAAPVPSVPPPGPAAVRPPGAKPEGKSKSKKGGAGAKTDRSERPDPQGSGATADAGDSTNKARRRRRGKGGSDNNVAIEPVRGGVEQRKKKRAPHGGTEADIAAERELIEQRRGRERNGKPIGRYLMCVQVRPGISQVAVLEGRNLIEHYVSRPADDISQIHGNIYLGRVQNVLPGMEAAFVDIATPKNAVLYRGDVQYEQEDIVEKGRDPRIEDILRARQMILCQVTKNPIGAKGARLTQEVSLPGRFVVLIPNSTTYGISKRLPDDTRKRLRSILDRIKPSQHGLIVRTAAEHATEADLEADMSLLLKQWGDIEAKAAKVNRPALLYREPELAVRVIREEFNADYRGVIIDDRRLYEEVRDYVEAFNPELADRIEYYDREVEPLSLFERNHVHEQVHKALDRKVWLPSGGSLIIEHTEALTVIDVNTGKNVGKSNLEETVFHNNMEAAAEIAKQLRLRDIGGIIVIDFIDMETRDNRAKVVSSFRDALARDKTRSQVFDISELGLVEMTRKRIGEGLLTEFSTHCPDCDGRGVVVDHTLLD